MKSFTQYLTESKKTYAFKIKVAGDLPESFAADLKTATEKFSVVSLSKGKRTPVQESPMDFPMLKNQHVTVFDLEVNYPTTPQVLEAYLAQSCNCQTGHVIVRTANQAAEEYIEVEKESKDTKALLDQDYETESNQDVVGTNRTMSLLKDLSKANSERKSTIVKIEGKSDAGASDPEFEGPKDGTVSPVGSKAVKGK